MQGVKSLGGQMIRRAATIAATFAVQVPVAVAQSHLTDMQSRRFVRGAVQIGTKNVCAYPHPKGSGL